MHTLCTCVAHGPLHNEIVFRDYRMDNHLKLKPSAAMVTNSATENDVEEH